MSFFLGVFWITDFRFFIFIKLITLNVIFFSADKSFSFHPFVRSTEILVPFCLLYDTEIST